MIQWLQSFLSSNRILKHFSLWLLTLHKVCLYCIYLSMPRVSVHSSSGALSRYWQPPVCSLLSPCSCLLPPSWFVRTLLGGLIPLVQKGLPKFINPAPVALTYLRNSFRISDCFSEVTKLLMKCWWAPAGDVIIFILSNPQQHQSAGCDTHLHDTER